MNVATAPQPQPILPSLLPRESWLDGIAGACLGSWMTSCMVLQIPEVVPLSVVATAGLLLAKVARVWGIAVGMGALGALLLQHPGWLRQDLLLHGGMVLALMNIWMLVGLRVRAEAEVAAPAFEAPLQDVERSLMPHSAQVKRDLDRAQAELSKERERLRCLEQELCESRHQLQTAIAERGSFCDQLQAAETQRDGLLAELEELRHSQQNLQEQITPMRLEAHELRAVLERTMVRSQDLEQQTALLDELKQTLRRAQDEVSSKQQTLDLQSSQLEAALQHLLQEQDRRAALEVLVQGNQQMEQVAQQSLEGVRQDLERQERVADSLLEKIVELEAASRASQESQALSQRSLSSFVQLAAQTVYALAERGWRRQEVLEMVQQLFQTLQGGWGVALLQARGQQQSSEAQLQLEQELHLAELCQADLQEQIQALREQLQEGQLRLQLLQQERGEILHAYENLQGELLNHQTLSQQRQQELQAMVEAAQRQTLHVAQSHHATVEHAISEAQRELEHWRSQAGEWSSEREALQEAMAATQAQAQHAQALLEMRDEEAAKLRQQLQDPQRLESLKRASMLERQMALKEQVIARLQTQQEQMPELMRTKHQHLQLREQFEAHRQTTEQLMAQNHQLQQQLLELQERVDCPEPSTTEAQLLELLYLTEQECSLLEQELTLSSAALRQLL